jgi:hypothetical protein
LDNFTSQWSRKPAAPVTAAGSRRTSSRPYTLKQGSSSYDLFWNAQHPLVSVGCDTAAGQLCCVALCCAVICCCSLLLAGMLTKLRQLAQHLHTHATLRQSTPLCVPFVQVFSHYHDLAVSARNDIVIARWKLCDRVSAVRAARQRVQALISGCYDTKRSYSQRLNQSNNTAPALLSSTQANVTALKAELEASIEQCKVSGDLPGYEFAHLQYNKLRAGSQKLSSLAAALRQTSADLAKEASSKQRANKQRKQRKVLPAHLAASSDSEDDRSAAALQQVSTADPFAAADAAPAVSPLLEPPSQEVVTSLITMGGSVLVSADHSTPLQQLARDAYIAAAQGMADDEDVFLDLHVSMLQELAPLLKAPPVGTTAVGLPAAGAVMGAGGDGAAGMAADDLGLDGDSPAAAAAAAAAPVAPDDNGAAAAAAAATAAAAAPAAAAAAAAALAPPAGAAAGAAAAAAAAPVAAAAAESAAALGGSAAAAAAAVDLTGDVPAAQWPVHLPTGPYELAELIASACVQSVELRTAWGMCWTDIIGQVDPDSVLQV